MMKKIMRKKREDGWKQPAMPARPDDEKKNEGKKRKWGGEEPVVLAVEGEGRRVQRRTLMGVLAKTYHVTCLFNIITTS